MGKIISLNIDEETLKKVDSLVGKNYRNRSHAFEGLLGKALNSHAVDTAVILCGGKGTRLRPITESVPKPMIRINGKPILEHVLDWLKSYDVSRFVFATGYKHEVIEDYFGDGEKMGVTIGYSREGEDRPLGTGGAVKKAAKRFDSAFLLANCDVLTNFNVADMVESHRRAGALVTVSLKPVREPSRFGVAEIEGSRIRRFVQKPAPGTAPSNLANAGVAVFEPDAVRMMPDRPHAFETELFPALAARGKLAGYPFTGPWVDVGVFETLEKASDIW